MTQRVKTVAGYEYHEKQILEGDEEKPGAKKAAFWEEKKPHDDYLRFPDEDIHEIGSPLGEFLGLAQTGIARHAIMKSGLLALNKIELGYPESKTGFSARQLNLLGDDTWLGEVLSVLSAHGWNKGHVILSDEIVERVRERLGSKVIEDARERYDDDWRNFILEVAAAHFVQPLTRLWYAANLISLYYVHQDDIAFGYLWSEYNIRLRHETDAVRGSKTKKSASAGGRVRGSAFSAQRQRVLSEIKRHLLAGHSISRASHLAFSNGYGTSAAANRKLFHRARKRK
jgi:hypothetical protein